MEERRRATRIDEQFVLRVECDEEPDGVAVARNRSETGMLFSSPTRFRLGQRLALARVEPDCQVSRTWAGRVVRIERPGGQGPVMQYLVAVALDP